MSIQTSNVSVVTNTTAAPATIKELKNQSVIGDVVANALPKFEDPSDMMECSRVARLELNFSRERQKKTLCPETFLNYLNVSQNPARPFLEKNILEIYRLIQKFPISPPLPFSTLFGLESFTILNELFDKEVLNQQEVNIWLSNYTAFCLSNFMLSGRDTTMTSQVAVNELDAFNRHLLDKPEISISTDKQLLIQKWIKVQELIKWFFLHPESQKLLNLSVSHCPGIIKDTVPQSTKDLQKATSDLSLYLSFINQSIQAVRKNKNVPTDLVVPSRSIVDLFKDIQKTINSANLNLETPVSKNKEKEYKKLIKDIYTPLFRLIIQNSPIFKSITPETTHKKCGDLFFSIYLKNILHVTNFFILKAASPFNNKMIALHNRIYHVLVKLKNNCEKVSFETELQNDFFSSRHEAPNSAKNSIKIICNDLIRKVSSFKDDYEKIIEICDEVFKLQIPILNNIPEILENFSRKIKPLCEESSRKLLELTLNNPKEFQGLPLLALTEEISPIFVAVHDFEMILHERSDWFCVVPIEYICFLLLRNKPETSPLSHKRTPPPLPSIDEPLELTPATNPSEFSSSKSPLNSTAKNADEVATVRFNFEEKKSPSELPFSEQFCFSAPSPIAKHSEKEQKLNRDNRSKNPPSLQHSPPLSPKHEEALDLNRQAFLDKAREITRRGIEWPEIEAILIELGFHSVEGKRHKKWLDNQNQLMTVTQHHDQPSRALTHAVHKQVITNSETSCEQPLVNANPNAGAQPAATDKKKQRNKARRK